jgi:hypothetical protein
LRIVITCSAGICNISSDIFKTSYRTAFQPIPTDKLLPLSTPSSTALESATRGGL